MLTFNELFGCNFGDRGRKTVSFGSESLVEFSFVTPRHDESNVSFHFGSGIIATFARRNWSVELYDAASDELLYGFAGGASFFVNESGVDPQSLEIGMDGNPKPARDGWLKPNTEYVLRFRRVDGLRNAKFQIVYTSSDDDPVESPAEEFEAVMQKGAPMYHPLTGEAGYWIPSNPE